MKINITSLSRKSTFFLALSILILSGCVSAGLNVTKQDAGDDYYSCLMLNSGLGADGASSNCKKEANTYLHAMALEDGIPASSIEANQKAFLSELETRAESDIDAMKK